MHHRRLVLSKMVNNNGKTDLLTESTITNFSTKEKLVSETALICWLELQRFFAQGVVMSVAIELDLVEVAALIADDNTEELAPLIANSQIAAVSNEQAHRWYSARSDLWSVVVAPFVLVQEPENAK